MTLCVLRRSARKAAALAIAATLSVGTPVLAQDLSKQDLSKQDLSKFEPGPEDRADAPSPGHDALYDAANAQPLIEACLKARAAEGKSRNACLGLTIDVCMRFSVNASTAGAIRCAGGEREAWEAIIAETLVEIAERGDEGVREAVEASQKTWEAHRRASCGIWGEVFRGGSLARQIGADCARESAGRRALDLIGVEESLIQ